MTINELKSFLSRFGIRPSKKLGQNFLLSEETLDQIIAAAELKSEDTILEIGPGLGVLTKRLAEKAESVIAVEKDRKIYSVLRHMFRNKKNVKVINEDALFFDFPNSELRSTNYKLVANIPYYITGKLLQNFLNAKQKPSHMVLLLQKEVAERIVAGPGDHSILSISVQFYADAEIISYVGKENFYPVPKVDSAIVRITPHLTSPTGGEEKNEEDSLPLVGRGREGEIDEKKFFQLVKLGFSNKRKQLHNNLTAINFNKFREASFNNFHMETGNKLKLIETNRNLSWKEVLGSLSLNPLCRAQDLSLQDWYALYKKFLP